jgi:hypothetical protein
MTFDPGLMCRDDCPVHCSEVCSCLSWPPEGLAPDCAVHGAVRAFNEATREIAELRAKIVELTDERDHWRFRYHSQLESW